MIDENLFASAAELAAWTEKLGSMGLRGTASSAHEAALEWIEGELRAIPGLELRHHEYEIARWRPVPEGRLDAAGQLHADGRPVLVAGAVPYSRAATADGELVYVPRTEGISERNARGKIVLREFPAFPLPADALLGNALHISPDCEELRGTIFDRPGLADPVLHADLLAAGDAGAAGLIFAFDLPHRQVQGYFDPHKGTHYRVPAVFAGSEATEDLRRLADSGAEATIEVSAVADRATTRNLFATLPGSTSERIVLVTHTDGNTWVQENGAAGLLALARYFASLPLDRRKRTLEFAFTTAHLHISREGGALYAEELDQAYDGGGIAAVIALEHLGVRELQPAPRADASGRELTFTGQAEPLLWAAGPSDALREAVIAAVAGRELERTIVAPGFGPALDDQVPRIASFGGLGTYFHTHLVPTTSLITGPWSLWAPAFGADAIDAELMRRQLLSAGDVVVALDAVPRAEIAGGYVADREARAGGARTCVEPVPPEILDEVGGEGRHTA